MELPFPHPEFAPADVVEKAQSYYLSYQNHGFKKPRHPDLIVEGKIKFCRVSIKLLIFFKVITE
jgi:hypothetical protein